MLLGIEKAVRSASIPSTDRPFPLKVPCYNVSSRSTSGVRVRPEITVRLRSDHQCDRSTGTHTLDSGLRHVVRSMSIREKAVCRSPKNVGSTTLVANALVVE